MGKFGKCHQLRDRGLARPRKYGNANFDLCFFRKAFSVALGMVDQIPNSLLSDQIGTFFVIKLASPNVATKEEKFRALGGEIGWRYFRKRLELFGPPAIPWCRQGADKPREALKRSQLSH